MIYPAMNDARHCEAITRLHARTFAVASRFLPPRKRRGAFAVYAFCRIADDIVDRGATGDRETLRRELAGYMSGLHAAIDGRPEGPVYRELHWTIKQFGVPASALLELMGGVAVDLAPAHYATWAELTAYCEGVASSVGEMCTYVFGVKGDEDARQRALRFARTLGVALQPIRMTGARDRVKKKAYIRTTVSNNTFFDGFAAKLKTRAGWRVYEETCGHDMMVDQPTRLADILLERA